MGHAPQTAARRPLFDQLIANKYEPGEGLKPHVDLMRFQDGIAIVTLQAAAILSFTKGIGKLDVLLSPGDLLLLEGEARCRMALPACALHLVSTCFSSDVRSGNPKIAAKTACCKSLTAASVASHA